MVKVRKTYFDATNINQKLRVYKQNKIDFQMMLKDEAFIQAKTIEGLCLSAKDPTEVTSGLTNKFFSLTENIAIIFAEHERIERKELLKRSGDIMGVEIQFARFGVENRFLIDCYLEKLDDNKFTWGEIQKKFKENFGYWIERSTIYRRLYLRILPKLDKMLIF